MKKYIFGTLIGLAAFTLVGGAVAFAYGGNGFSMIEDKAEMLGMTSDELKAELENKSMPEILDEKGITHTQLFELRESKMLEQQAAMLDMSVDDLKAELENKTFAQLLDEKGITHTQLMEKKQERMRANMTERLQTMVDNGEITQEQMQEKLEWMEGHAGGGCGGKGFGGRGMFKPF
ncbi:hypothetical protein KKF61_03850 [Patescibacteria group bacterium]|nr:hypothetical protein [Patescibacteria group bacterium]MBU0964164.1 hypothetical protein [Patescibacteria group bacterium]